MHRISASFAGGLNGPVSMELMVLRDTPTISASACWEIAFGAGMLILAVYSFWQFCAGLR